MFDVALVNTEEGVVSVFQELLFWREGLDTRLWRSSLKVKCDMIIRAGAQGEVKDGRDCMMKKTHPRTGVKSFLITAAAP